MTTRERWQIEEQLLERLQEEIHRIAEREPYSKSSIALGALQLISCWAMEEAVEPAEE